MSSKNKQSFMNRFIAFMEKYFEPVAARIEKQRHISSIKNGMIALISVLIIGSFSLIISAIGNMFPAGSVVKNSLFKMQQRLTYRFNLRLDYYRFMRL